MRVMPSEGSGRYSPGPGMVKLLEEMVLPGSTSLDGNLFTQSARYPCYSLVLCQEFIAVYHIPTGRCVQVIYNDLQTRRPQREGVYPRYGEARVTFQRIAMSPDLSLIHI